MAKSAAYRIYANAILLYLQEHEVATPGLLHYHGVCRDERDMHQCLAEMQEAGQIEPCGVETESAAYRGQTLYQVRKFPYWQERALIELALDHADEELLGLQRSAALTYDQYAEVAGLLVDARAKLRGYLSSREGRE